MLSIFTSKLYIDIYFVNWFESEHLPSERIKLDREVEMRMRLRPCVLFEGGVSDSVL